MAKHARNSFRVIKTTFCVNKHRPWNPSCVEGLALTSGSRTFFLRWLFHHCDRFSLTHPDPFLALPLLFQPRHRTRVALSLRAELIAKAPLHRPTGKRTQMEFLLQNVTIKSLYVSLLFQGSHRFSSEEWLMWLQRKRKNSRGYLLCWYPQTCSLNVVDIPWTVCHCNNGYYVNNVYTFENCQTLENKNSKN